MSAALRSLPFAFAACVGISALAACGSSSSSSGTSPAASNDLVFNPPTGAVMTATAGPLPAGALPFSQTFTVTSGGAPPFTFAAVTTPPGLSLAAAGAQPGLTGTLSAILSGTPSQSGLEPFTMTITDATGHAVQATWYVQVAIATPALQVTPATMPNGTRGQPYSVFLTANNGTTPFTWTVTSGTLPPGLNFTPSTGVNFQLSGTPTTAGTFSFTVTAGDGSTPQRTATLNLSVTVK
jgi:hypothetical protein